jgi:hypothetical protein
VANELAGEHVHPFPDFELEQMKMSVAHVPTSLPSLNRQSRAKSYDHLAFHGIETISERPTARDFGSGGMRGPCHEQTQTEPPIPGAFLFR